MQQGVKQYTAYAASAAAAAAAAVPCRCISYVEGELLGGCDIVLEMKLTHSK
jgi:glutaredoxin-related protein